MADDRDLTTPRAPRRRGRVARAATALLVALALLAAGMAAWLPSQSALEIAIARAEGASGGRLKVSGASGTLLSTIRAAELRWDGPETTLVAREVALDWSPWSLVGRRIVIRGLGMQALDIAVRGGANPATLPDSLALPLDVSIAHIGVGRLDWAMGGRRGQVTGLQFGYAGDGREHRVHEFALVFDRGRLTGEFSLAAAAPFATTARLAFRGTADSVQVEADARFAGPLERLLLDASGRIADARVTARAEVTPFAPVPVAKIALDASAVNLAMLDARLPATLLGGKVEATPVDGGYAGTFNIANAAPGALDAGRIPLAALSAKFMQRGQQVVFDDIVAAAPGGARARGRGTLEFTSAAPMTWALAVENLDLAQLHSKLTTTQLQGRLAADLDAERQRVTGELADRRLELALSFAASIAGRRVEVTRARLAARSGTLEGSGHVSLDGAQPFAGSVEARQFDPSRYGNFPGGSLDGSLRASGMLAPAWRADVEATIAPGSKLAGLAAAGSAKATLGAASLSAATLELRLGATRVSARGGAGNAGDRIAFTLDARNLAELALFAPAGVPRPLGGALRLDGTLVAEPGGTGGNASLHADNLKVGTLASAGTLDARFALAPGRSGDTAVAYADRSITVDIAAAKLMLAATPLASARVGFDGSLGQHVLKLAATGDGIVAEARARGSLARNAAGEHAWSGRLENATTQGFVKFHLVAPAPIDVARDRVRIGTAELALVDGRIRLDEFAWDGQRVTTRGAFDGVPALALARLASYEFPLATDVTLAGDWSIAANPRLNGALRVRREHGDVYATTSTGPDQSEFSFGIRTLALEARLHDDALEGSATLRSRRAGNADATFGVAAGPAAGRIATDTPLMVKLAAELTSLAPLQRWLGTFAALAGRARVDLTGSGTLAAPLFTGTLEGDELRFDSPRLGVHLADGRVRAKLADNVLALDEFSIAGGEGRFEAKGTLARANGAGGAKLTWKADDFRAVNRPDLRLVVAGEGALGVAERKIRLEGRLRVVEGRVDYRPPRGTALGDDVVVIGRPRAPEVERAGPMPLALDLDVDFGNRLEFEGEGLRTGLEGRVRVTTTADGTLQGRGTIQAVHGTYDVFGQRLTIDRGQLIFNGPLDNPALDIIALRKNLAVEAGVALTGTVRVPLVRLTSNPPVPDSERLAWLITGQGTGSATGADSAALSAASAMLLGRGGRPVRTQVAERFGLDDISVRGSSTAGTPGGSAANSQVIAFGKRISDRMTIVYEQGLTIATNALRIEYTLSRTLTLRAEAGVVSGFGIYYRRSYE